MCDYTLEDYNEIQHIKKKIKINNDNIDKLSNTQRYILNKYNKLYVENEENKIKQYSWKIFNNF
jgi:hypothetical protein